MKKEEKEVHVFRYSQLISTERKLTISEFSDHSGKYASRCRHSY